MKLHSKLLLATASILLLTGSLHLCLSYQAFTALLEDELRHEARQIQNMLMSIRHVYHQQFLASGLPVDEKTVGFLPAHALSRISADFYQRNDSGLSFNNVSDQARNPDNTADAFEQEALAWFRENPEAKERKALIRAADGQQYYHYASPIWIESYCLKCHGVQEIAPASIVKRYAAGYDYEEGDLRGVISIKIPTAVLRDRLWSMWQQQLLLYVVGYGLTFLALAGLIQRLVSKRLAQLEQAAQHLAQGEYSQRVAVQGEDEISTLAKSFNHMATAIQQRDKDLRHFAEVTAHHLQEPARRLVSYSERLHQHLKECLHDPEDLLSLQFIHEQASRQRQLLHDVELYLAADQARGPVEQISVAAVIYRLVEGQDAGGKVLYAENLPAINMDYPRVADIFSLLLNNAFCHACPREQQVQVQVQGFIQGPWLHYTITDNGPGIEAAYRERVFRVFERLHPQHPGTGIGLAIVRRIIESVGGRVWIEAGPEGGCCVHLVLPHPVPSPSSSYKKT